jgi:UDP-glucose 4-epimerase
MPSALLTGATGFVGGHLCQRLVRDGWDVTALVRDGSIVVDEAVRHVRADLEHLRPDAFGGEAFDVVFHLAASIPKVSGTGDPEAIVAANAVGTQRLLAATAGAGRLVFASSVDVYAPAADGAPLTERSRLDPRTVYAASKLLGERLVEAAGIEAVVLRFGHLYGPGEEAFATFIPKTIANLMRGRPPYVYGDGSAQVDVLYVDDAVEAALRAATRPRTAATINVVHGTSHALRAIAEQLVACVGFLGEIRYVADRPQGPSTRFDAALMREALGRWPLVDLEEGLRREVAHVAEASRAVASGG